MSELEKLKDINEEIKRTQEYFISVYKYPEDKAMEAAINQVNYLKKLEAENADINSRMEKLKAKVNFLPLSENKSSHYYSYLQQGARFFQATYDYDEDEAIKAADMNILYATARKDKTFELIDSMKLPNSKEVKKAYRIYSTLPFTEDIAKASIEYVAKIDKGNEIINGIKTDNADAIREALIFTAENRSRSALEAVKAAREYVRKVNKAYKIIDEKNIIFPDLIKSRVAQMLKQEYYSAEEAVENILNPPSKDTASSAVWENGSYGYKEAEYRDIKYNPRKQDDDEIEREELNFDDYDINPEG